LSGALALCEDFNGLNQGPDTGFLNMIKKLALAVAVAAVAVSFAPTLSFAKMHHHMMKPCTPGSMSTLKPNNMGWGQVEMCGTDGKWYDEPMMCYVPSGLCPK
jgi:hypothetical protein